MVCDDFIIKQSLTRPCDPQKPGWTPPCPKQPPLHCDRVWGWKEFEALSCQRGPWGNETEGMSRDPKPTCWGSRAASATDAPSPSPEEEREFRGEKRQVWTSLPPCGEISYIIWMYNAHSHDRTYSRLLKMSQFHLLLVIAPFYIHACTVQRFQAVVLCCSISAIIKNKKRNE